MSIKRDAAFEAFVSTAQGIMGNDLSTDWLFEVWSGADADPNRALNHVLDSPEDKIRRNGGSGGNKSSSEAKTPKKSSKPRESKPAPATPATTWGDDDYPAAPTPPPQQHQAPPAAAQPQQFQQQYAPPQPMPFNGQPQQSYMQQSFGGPMMQGQQPMMQQPMMQQMAPQMMSQPMMSQPMMGQPMMSQPTFTIDPMTGLPMAPMNPVQQAQAMFVQQQQQQRLMMLKNSIDSVLSNPATLTSPQIMQNLQDTMIQALEAPNATLQLAERARQSQQTAQFIQIMQSQVSQMLCDPKVATNPALLQQLNTQMNQLRMLTMQHVAQQQIDANPASALSLSMPVLTPPNPSVTLLSRAVAQSGRLGAMGGGMNSAVGGLFDDACTTNPNPTTTDEDWWAPTPKKSSSSLSEKNPFRDNDTETVAGSAKNLGLYSPRNTAGFSSHPNLLNNMYPGMMMPGSMPTVPMGPMFPGMMPMSMPAMGGMGGMGGMGVPTMGANLAGAYGAMQPGYMQPMQAPNYMGQFGRQF